MLLRFAHGEAGESEARPRYVITRVTSAAVSGHAGTLAAYGQTFNATKSTPPPGFPLIELRCHDSAHILANCSADNTGHSARDPEGFKHLVVSQ